MTVTDRQIFLPIQQIGSI